MPPLRTLRSTSNPRVPFSALATTLSEAMVRCGVRSEPAYYLFGAYDEVSDNMPRLAGVDDWMSEWCADCAVALVKEAQQAPTGRGVWDGRDTEGWEVCAKPCYGEGEGPSWCRRCGVYLDVGFTWCSVDTVLSAWRGKRLTQDALPEIIDAVEYFGDGPPFWCGGCPWNSPMRRNWHPPTVVIDLTRWHETAHMLVDMPCCGCRHSVRQPAREAQDTIRQVRRWQAVRQLALRAVRYYGE